MDRYIKIEWPESQYYEDYDISDGVYHCVATDFENDESIPVVFVLATKAAELMEKALSITHNTSDEL